jgi:hypothetical protein
MPPEDRDNELLDALRRVIGAADPLPAHVEDAAREALTWRTVDDELARLLRDSSAEPALAGVRAGEEPRVLGFAGADLRVEFEVSGSGAERTLIGQLLPAGAARIEIRHADRTTTVDADERGRFSAAGVPAGSISLRCLLQGRPHALVTPWLPI